MKVLLSPAFCALALSLLFFSANTFAQLSATATATDASCPGQGSITVTATGGTTPYSYSINNGTSWQANNVFPNIVAGTYNVQVKDAANVTVTVTGVVVKNTYKDMSPTATPQNELCSGSNTGSIKLSMPTGQGTAPFTYSIVSGPTSQAPVTNTSNVYTFQNLAPGTYQVRVTDACGDYQTRQATLVPAAAYDLTLYAWARPSSCGQMDYYLQPLRGADYPQTIYAFNPAGTLVNTLTLNSSADLVSVPGYGSLAAKFSLPNPATFQGTYYTFKYTDACVTDVNNSRVKPITPSLGNYQISATNRNCALDMDVKVLEGWKMNVSVSVKPASGTAIIKTIADEATRMVSFSGLAPGIYTVEITDDCGRTKTVQYSLQAPALGGRVSTTCSGNIPGTQSIDILDLNQGWQASTLVAKITSGPATYYSSLMDQTFKATYPVSAQPTNNIIRFTNMAPGDYTIEISDGCNTKVLNYTLSATGAAFTIPKPTVTGCAGSRVLNLTASAACASTGFYANVRKGANEAVLANGVAPKYSFSNIQKDFYTIYYYSNFAAIRTNVFQIPASDIYQGNSLLIKKDTITVTDAPTVPKISSALSAKCTDGSVTVKLIPDATAAKIKQYQMENSDGSFTPYQTSNIFTVNAYGQYNFRVEDECGNAEVSAVNITPNPAPEVKSSGNNCIGGDINLYVEIPDNATAEWAKPNGTKVTGKQLFIQNASQADKGIYTVKVTYTLGNCTEVIEKSVELADCMILPVNWGSFNAIIKNGQLVVNWSTLIETNNKFFEIQVSKDAKKWETIGKINSAATDGNSTAEIKYEFQKSLSGVLGLLGLPLLMALLGLRFRRNRKTLLLLALTAATVIGSFAGCRKEKSTAVSDTNTKLWVRIGQVDQDGTVKYSKAIQAVNE